MRKGGHGSFPGERKPGGWRTKRKKVGLGIVEDPFALAAKNPMIWPLTVWELDFKDPMMGKLKCEIQDGVRTSDANLNVTISVFNPLVVIYIMDLFGRDAKVVYDPFAGGGTRAIVCAKQGLEYIGVEVREEEVEAIFKRLDSVNAEADIICGDSRCIPEIADQSADFLITCPPYYNLEMYNGGANDLSMAATYDDFLDGIEKVIKECHRILKPGALSCWVVGLHRDKKGQILSIPSDIVNICKSNGFFHKEEIILYWDKEVVALRRLSTFNKGNHFLIRCHEHLEVFVRKESI